MLSLTGVAAFPAAGHADSENSLRNSSLFGKRGTPATTTTAQSPSSGIPATTETKVINDGSVAPFITPNSSSEIQKLAERYSKIVAEGGWPEVPRGRTKKGSKGRAVGALNQRLFMEGYLQEEATKGQYAELFTSATEDALRRFQSNHGLLPTGIMDGPTLAALNVPAAERLATIKANIPRLAEYSKDLGNRYIVVNVPAQQIEAVSDGKVYSLHNAIVGRDSRPTPVVMTPLTIVRFNPYWNAPASIVERDILPRMLSRGPSKVLADMNMKVYQGVGGPEVNPDKIDWRSAKIEDYHFRQEPGGENAMATAKIEFNSPFGIYLHDTPEPSLFKTANRFYSSGCVRVDQVAILLNWILQGQDGIDQAKIASLAETKERLDVTLTNPPQLRVAYLTAWPTKDGVAAFRSDIYELDGTGFVVGQPLPVGEKKDGQRFVLKPIPYLQQDIDSDNGGGGFFASLFGSRKTEAAKSQTDAKQLKKQQGAGSLFGSKSKTETADAKLKKPLVKKADEKAKTAAKKETEKPVKVAKTDPKADDSKAKPLVKKDDAKTADKPAEKPAAAPDTKQAAKPAAIPAPDAKKPEAPAAATATAAAPKAAEPPKAQAPAAAPAKAGDCMPGADGKLPAGCSAPSAAPQKKPDDKSANAAN